MAVGSISIVLVSKTNNSVLNFNNQTKFETWKWEMKIGSKFVFLRVLNCIEDHTIASCRCRECFISGVKKERR